MLVFLSLCLLVTLFSCHFVFLSFCCLCLFVAFLSFKLFVFLPFFGFLFLLVLLSVCFFAFLPFLPFYLLAFLPFCQAQPKAKPQLGWDSLNPIYHTRQINSGVAQISSGTTHPPGRCQIKAQTCSWLVHQLVHDLFMTCLQLVYDLLFSLA